MGIADLFRNKKSQKLYPYDPEKEYPVIKSSICTGEKTAGFKNKETGHFAGVMLITSPADEQEFKTLYGIDELRTEY